MIEVRLAEEHINRLLVSQAVTTQSAIGSVLSKEGHKAFKKLIEGLSDGN